MKLINFLTICILLSCFNQGIKAQTYYGDLFIYTQAEVDAFNYTEVTGRLWISDSYSESITNLNGLSELTAVGGELEIVNNLALSDCCGIQDLLNTPGAVVGYISVNENQPGCGSIMEVQNAPCSSSDADSDGVDDEDDNCPNTSNPGQGDADCDGIGDTCDLCPGGDDSVDYNQDGIADCSQLLSYNDYSPAWQCANNKIYVCHNDNNPQTICIDANSLLPAHYSHGDMVGPCTSCPQNFIQPGANDIQVAGTLTEQSKIKHSDESTVVQVEMEINPNPANDHLEIQANLSPAVISIMDISGKVVYQQELSKHTNTVNTSSLIGGIYFIRLYNGTNCYVKNIVVIH